MNHSITGALLLTFWILSLLNAAAQPKPPPVPAVRPLIAKKYSTDTNNDRVEDLLFDKASKAVAAQKSATTPAEKTKAEAALNQMVEVELIFSDQIKQQQLDAFTRNGGKVTYVYKAVSFGWNGLVPVGKITALPTALGDSLLLIKESRPMKLHMDTATKTGRVRPIWASGFGGSVSGFDGSTNITIGILDTGVDESHTDFAGRKVYWQDFSSDSSLTPIDTLHHGSHVAGIALGSGAAGGSGAGSLFFTDHGNLTGAPNGAFAPTPIELPTGPVTITATARWTGGGTTSLRWYSHVKGTAGGFGSHGSISGVSPLTLILPFSASETQVYTPGLLSNGSMGDYAVNVQVPNYPASTDGFNKFRGVAPGCNWAGAKVFSAAGAGFTTWTDAAVDDMVANRAILNIKVINLSLGTIGDPGIDPAGRQKINTAANNGIVVVVAAGNDGDKTTPGQRELDDPGRAAMALTVGAANDVNQLTSYTSQGFASPGSDPGQEEDYKPDVIAPGGSSGFYSSIMAPDSNSSDGAFADQQANDYYNIQGTSMATPFVAGCAALVIDALETKGTNWNFVSSEHVRLVKMLLCATTSESNTPRESSVRNPTLERATTGPSGYPAGKDPNEGFGMINPDAAVDAVSLTYPSGSTVTTNLGPAATDQRVWARRVTLLAGQAFTPTLTNPATGDFDFYLYSTVSSAYGTPILLASSTQSGNGVHETFNYTPLAGSAGILVVKRVSGSGTFTVTSPPLVGPQLSATEINGVITLIWNASPGTTYKVQYKDDLNQATWNDLTTVTASSSTATANDTVSGSQRFYRVVVL